MLKKFTKSKKKTEGINTKKEIKQMKKYINSLEKFSKELKRYKHDWNNIILTLDEFIKKKDMDGLSKYYYETLRQNFKFDNIRSEENILQLANIRIISLKGIIFSKAIYAQSLGINFKIEIPEEINEIIMDKVDLCRIIGNLLDNAIEANIDLCNKEIYLYILKKSEYLKFIVLNLHNNKNLNIYEIYKEGFSTKGKGRGTGLSNVQDILREKYPNVFLNTKIEKNIFRQEIIIQDKK